MYYNGRLDYSIVLCKYGLDVELLLTKVGLITINKIQFLHYIVKYNVKYCKKVKNLIHYNNQPILVVLMNVVQHIYVIVYFRLTHYSIFDT